MRHDLADIHVRHPDDEASLRRYVSWMAEGAGARRFSRKNETDLWFVMSAEEVKRLLLDRRLSADSGLPGFPGEGPGEPPERRPFARLEGARHRTIRRAVMPVFRHSAEVDRQRFISDLVDRHVRFFLSSPSHYGDLTSGLAAPLMSAVIGHLLGIPGSDYPTFARIAMELHEGVEPGNRESMLRRTELFDELRSLLHEILANHRWLQGGLLQHLSAAVNSGDITEQDAENSSVLMVSAGHDTTAIMISLVVLAAMREEMLPQLSDDDEGVRLFVEETLRHASVIQSISARVAVDDVPVADGVVRQGDGVLLLTMAANHDPAVFSDPFHFHPGRDGLDGHMAFGRGLHACVGQMLARDVLAAVVRSVARAAPQMQPSRTPKGRDYVPMAAVTTLRRLYVEW